MTNEGNKQPKPKPVQLDLGPAEGSSSTRLDLSTPTVLNLGAAEGHSDARLELTTPGLAAGTIIAASGAVVGPDGPQPESVPEGLGVLSWVGAGAALGYEVGNSIDKVPGGLAGAVIGFAGACTVVRWEPAREKAFEFIRWLRDEKAPPEN